MKSHLLWMIIGCTLPLLLIFLAPALGLSGDMSLLIFVIAMFACHLLMPMHHVSHRHKDELQDQPSNNKLKEHEPYQR
ncbi:hypothetical protein [Pontibacter rugosus]|uniref:DUF2933 domain-containing protein n=1 Tax=Pontibacter rugosus TaxID=1745966 RepID=A0ABW3STB1_9BACT